MPDRRDREAALRASRGDLDSLPLHARRWVDGEAPWQLMDDIAQAIATARAEGAREAESAKQQLATDLVMERHRAALLGVERAALAKAGDALAEAVQSYAPDDVRWGSINIALAAYRSTRNGS